MSYKNRNATQQSETSPATKVKEVPIVFDSNTVVCNNAMVVHVVNASIAATAMVYPCMQSDTLAFAAWGIAIWGTFSDQLLAWNNVAWVRPMAHDQTHKNLDVAKDEKCCQN